MKRIVLLLTVLLALVACDSGPKFTRESEWLIHNQSDKAISVSIDGKSISLAPGKGETITLQAGEHSFVSPLTGPLKFVVYVNSKGGLINPTLLPYVIESINYQRKPDDKDFWGPMKNTISVDGVEVEGMYKLSSELFIDKDWTFAPGEKVPDEITTYDSAPQNAIRNKIYSKAEFLKVIGATSVTPDPAPTWQAPASAPEFATFESAELEKAAASIKASHTEYFTSTDPERHIAIQQGQMKALQPLLDAYSKAGSKLSQADIEAYSQIVGGDGGAVWRGARVLPAK